MRFDFLVSSERSGTNLRHADSLTQANATRIEDLANLRSFMTTHSAQY
jgi:hypothetical protein